MLPRTVFMGRSRKKYSAEFKLEAVRMASEGGRPPTHVARGLGISPSMIHRWIAEFEERGASAFSGPRKPEVTGCDGLLSAEEVRRLRRERDEAREERDILKKALADCANQQD